MCSTCRLVSNDDCLASGSFFCVISAVRFQGSLLYRSKLVVLASVSNKLNQ
jgi:hypothetical protein